MNKIPLLDDIFLDLTTTSLLQDKKEYFTDKNQKNPSVIKNDSDLPHLIEAENLIISSILQKNDLLNVAMVNGLKSSHFFHSIYTILFVSFLNLNSKHLPINIISLTNELLKSGDLIQVQNSKILDKITNNSDTPNNFLFYIKIVIEKSYLRSLIKIANTILVQSYEQRYDVSTILNEAETNLISIRSNDYKKKIFNVKEITNTYLSKIKKQIHGDFDKTDGISSGFKTLDYLTNGFQPGELIIIAARPSMGKTSLVLSIASNLILFEKKSVLIFSMEMTAEQLLQRIIAASCSINLLNLRKGHLDYQAIKRLNLASRYLKNSSLFIDESSNVNIPTLENKCRFLIKKNKIDLIIMDYLQLMSPIKLRQNKAIEIGEISKGLKNVAREFKIPIIALSQLNRSVELRQHKKPLMSDLRDSGTIEEDADLILLLFRDEYYSKEHTRKDKIGMAELIISKNRNGPLGIIKLNFDSKTTRFREFD